MKTQIISVVQMADQKKLDLIVDEIIFIESKAQRYRIGNPGMLENL